ncbi:MAG: hypothetical protein ACRC92_27060 [Peptostreptococcaceae bacterium]
MRNVQLCVNDIHKFLMELTSNGVKYDPKNLNRVQSDITREIRRFRLFKLKQDTTIMNIWDAYMIMLKGIASHLEIPQYYEALPYVEKTTKELFGESLGFILGVGAPIYFHIIQ